MKLMPANHTQLRFTRIWFWTGISALAIAGLFAVLLVAARSPYIQSLIPYQDFFKTALTIHVNLSVLVWLLCGFCMMANLASANTPRSLQKISFTLAGSGTLLMILSAFTIDGHPLLNNYVPVLDNAMFHSGLTLFGIGIALQALFAIVAAPPENTSRTLIWGVKTMAIIIVIAVACLLASHFQLQLEDGMTLYSAADYYERLFWGGGHILQFAYTQLLMIAWIVLAGIRGLRLPHPVFLTTLFTLQVMIVLITPYAYKAFAITSFEHIDFFTQQMRYGGGIAPTLLMLWILAALTFSDGKTTRECSALRWSILLFGVGGILGSMITESNTTIPAHYHGSIVGVTLALMGWCYTIMPQLSLGNVSERWACWQLRLYGGGQLIHITGLAWSGGYGALRKTPGAMQSVEGQAAMGLMGLGGLLSIIGGLLFVVGVWKARKKES